MKIKIIIWLAAVLALGCFAGTNNASAATHFGSRQKPVTHRISQIKKPVKKICPRTAKISVKIINKGAPASLERAVWELLSAQKQLGVVIGQKQGPDIEQTAVFFKEEKFRLEAQAIAQLLREKEEIFSYARKAETKEEKSAGIVIMLGKSKEAPPN